MMRVIEGVLPRVVLIENVPGFAGKGVCAGLKSIEAGFKRINHRRDVAYRISSAVVDAADTASRNIEDD
jgi:site-specific DNA-cytosine methylase